MWLIRSNGRIMCWSSGLKEGRVVVGGNGRRRSIESVELVQQVYHLMLRTIFMLPIQTIIESNDLTLIKIKKKKKKKIFVEIEFE